MNDVMAGKGAAAAAARTTASTTRRSAEALGAAFRGHRALRQASGRVRRLRARRLLLLVWQYVSTSVLDETRAYCCRHRGHLLRGVGTDRLGDLWRHLGDSLKREAVAFLWATIAIPLGIAMGWWKAVDEQFDPLMEVLRPIPPLAWIPLSILWFGIGDTQNQFIIFLGIFFPILLNTITGVRGVEPNLVRAARCLGASEWAILSRVVLRAALPQIITGIRIGLGVGWMALVAAELVGASSGLGFLINDARTICVPITSSSDGDDRVVGL